MTKLYDMCIYFDTNQTLKVPVTEDFVDDFYKRFQRGFDQWFSWCTNRTVHIINRDRIVHVEFRVRNGGSVEEAAR